MSRWIAALMRAASSGRASSSASVPSISGGQTKRIVRAGAGIAPSRISLASVRATSRIVAQPLALSFAPGRGWSRWQLKTISSLAPLRIGARDGRRRDVVGARMLARLARPRAADRLAAARAAPGTARACFSETMKANVGVFAKRVEVPPAHQVLVLAPPGRALVLRVADDAGRAARLDRQRRHRRRLRRRRARSSRARPCPRSRLRACPRRRRPASAVTSALSLSCASESGIGFPARRRACAASPAASSSHSSANSASHAGRELCVP